jgi:Na+-translocating ferredoxin:NAD+ oxidoreductase subunit B
MTLAERIFAALPQTQCTRCGYPDCQAYANAIAHEGAAINQCSPGGAEGIHRLSQITGQTASQLNPENGIEGPRSVAWIEENWCIGCTLCIDVCPTDAIIGSNKLMHTVIEPHCTGCELCIPVCPVDCIELENVTGKLTGWAAWSSKDAEKALKRYTNRYTIHSGLDGKYADYSQFNTSKIAIKNIANENIANEVVDKTETTYKTDKSAVIAAAIAKAKAKAMAKTMVVANPKQAGKNT